MEEKKLKKIVELINKDIDENKVTIAYQPIVSTEDKKVSSLESLFRFDNSLLNCNLEKVINIAKKNGLLNKITKFVISNIIEDFAKWRHKKVIREDFLISFNISATQLDNEFYNYIVNKINGEEIKSHNMVLEIKEAKELTEENKRILEKLSDQKFKIALDDINLEEDYINSLIKLPYHMIKIDKDFVKNVVDNKPIQKSIVESIVNLSKNSKLKVVVSGIENKGHESAMESLNPHYQQGFLYSRPVLKDEIIETIKNLQ